MAKDGNDEGMEIRKKREERRGEILLDHTQPQPRNAEIGATYSIRSAWCMGSSRPNCGINT